MGVKTTVEHVTKKGKRCLGHKEPRILENPKMALFMRTNTASQSTIQLMKEIEVILRNAHTTFSLVGQFIREIYNTTNFSGRLFDYHLLDMFELGMEDFMSMQEFKNPKITQESKSVLVFNGELFEIDDTYIRLKNLLIDFFKGPEVTDIRLDGLEHAWVFTAIEDKVLVRSYRLIMNNSDGQTPVVNLLEIGPRVDFCMRRTKLASDDLFRHACKQPAENKTKKVKNVSQDAFGSKIGRVHMSKQDLTKLSSRRVKALKKRGPVQPENAKNNQRKRKSAGAKKTRAKVAKTGSGGSTDQASS